MSDRRRPRPPRPADDARQKARYRKHRQAAAVRRRRLALLVVVALTLGVVGVAMAWPGGDAPAPSAAGQTAAPDDAAEGGGDGEASAEGGGESAEAEPPAAEPIPDWQPSPQAQAAIDEALANGRPPQFIVASFDGAADYRMYDRWLNVADDVGARFTFFISGIYLILPENAEKYLPPQAEPGFSNLGGYAELAGPKSARENLVDNVADFNEARMLGHEIGSHYVSHICEPADAWTTEDWISEESQWEDLMLDPGGWNGFARVPEPIYTKDDFHGGRSPCLAGDKPALYRAMKQMGREYDASQTGILGQWPERQQGLWNFPLPGIPSVGHDFATLAMDYNFYVNHGSTDDPGEQAALSERTYQSYIGAIDSLYNGNRAPYITGSHFANWNGGAYMDALERTLREACTRPETACVTSITLARWLDQQSPADLRRWQAGDFPGGPGYTGGAADGGSAAG